MPLNEKILPPVQTLTLEDVETAAARLGAARLANEAELRKLDQTDYTKHHLENPLSDQAKFQLGGTALGLTMLSHAEFVIPADEN
ncbi:MAG TPA: hypothetical protein VGO98_00120 [Candidatus Saccharimonadales bacterium]|jgi:hypothetical protein|nr:hypothetical protein [Candidatus Saccharimonadales bacterium]